VKIIFHDVEPDDFILATRAARWLMDRCEKKTR
jgi:hypothetical protein